MSDIREDFEAKAKEMGLDVSLRVLCTPSQKGKYSNWRTQEAWEIVQAVVRAHDVDGLIAELEVLQQVCVHGVDMFSSLQVYEIIRNYGKE